MGVRPDPLDHGRYWDATAPNVVGGCVIADRSCYFCYAAPYAGDIHAANEVELYRGTVEWRNGRWTWTGLLTKLPPDHPHHTYPLRWPGVEQPLLGPGKPSILWLNSMTDLFVPGRPTEDFDRLLVNTAISPHNIIGLILTKYPKGMVEYFSTKPAWWRKRFILVFSAGDQRWWDVRWRIMRPLAEAGWIVGTSIQPMLGPVVLPPDFLRLGRWVICGGEQHPGHRVMDEDDARALCDQVKAAGLPIFVKQMTTGWLPLDLLFRELPKV
jgi:protein gp37